MPKLTVREIVEQRLKQDGYDGLWNSLGECSCQLDDLWPIECLSEDCIAGHYVPCPGGDCEGAGIFTHFHIGEKP